MATNNVADGSIEQAAKDALKRPESFFTSDEAIGVTHALTISVHRDSDILNQSNWEVIKEDMLKRFPDDVYVHSSSHWAHGWSDELAVRVFVYPHPAIGAVVSPAFRAILEWRDALEDYPVADEMHYSEMEHADAVETLENSYNVPKDRSGEAFSWLFDTYSYSSAEEYNENAVADMFAALGLDCQDCGLYRAKRLHTRKLQYGTQAEALCVSCYIDATRRK